MSKELKKVFSLIEGLLPQENPYVNKKDRIEWENEVFYVVVKFIQKRYYVLASLGDSEIFSGPEGCAKFLMQFYLDNYTEPEGQAFGTHLTKTLKNEGLTSPDIDVQTGIPWHHLEAMEAGMDHYPIRNLHLLARAMGKKVAFVDK